MEAKTTCSKLTENSVVSPEQLELIRSLLAVDSAHAVTPEQEAAKAKAAAQLLELGIIEEDETWSMDLPQSVLDLIF